MKNKHIYQHYKIQGWPCIFWDLDTVSLYHNKLKKYCEELPDGAEDFTRLQKIKLKLYYNTVLMILDGVFYKRTQYQMKNAK